MKTGILYIGIILLSFFLGCSDNELIDNAYPEPFIKISNPLMNSNVTDSTTVSITSNIDNLVRVELYIDHSIPSQQAVFQQTPYEYLWNTIYYQDGSQHILQAKGYDSYGNTYDSKYVIINVYRFRPSSLIAFLQTDTLISLNWIDNCTYETGFEIEEAVNDSDFVKIAEVDSNVTYYNVSDSLSLNDVYYFRVRAKSKDGYSGYSNIATVNIQLNMPIGLELYYLSDTAVTLRWTDNNISETGYIIKEFIPGQGHVFVKELPANTTETVIADTFLAGQYKDYFLFPCIGHILGEAARFPLRTFQFPAPFDLIFQSTNYHSISISWSDNNYYELGFIIERGENGTAYSEIGRTSGHSFTDFDPDTTKNLSYRVAAYSRYNKSDYSPRVDALYAPKLNLINKFPVIYDITWAALSYDASIIAFGGYSSIDADIYLYHTFTGQQFKVLNSPDSSSQKFKHITISADNNLLAAVGENNYITVWNINTGAVVKRISNQIYPFVMQFSYDGKYLIAGSGSTIRFYDVSSWQYETKITTTHYISRLAVNDDETVIATGDGYTNVTVWDYNTGSMINQFPGSANAYPLVLNKAGTRLFSAFNDRLYVWDVLTGAVALSIPDFKRKQHIAVNESKNIVASSINDWDLGITDLNRGCLFQQLSSPSGFEELFFTPDNNYLIGRETNQYYYIWHIDRGWISLGQ